MPYALRVKINLHIYQHSRKTIEFFQKIKTLPDEFEQNRFIAWICPLLTPVPIQDENMI
jgi:hypothetical protein